jgi:hypothetical protein
MTAENIISKDSPYNLKVFAALAMSRATRWQIGEIEDMTEAVDWLQQYACNRDLVREHGQDEIQRIIWLAFRQVQDDAVPGVNGERRWVP